MAEPVVAFDRIKVVYRGGVRALADVTVSFPPGVTGLVGINGAGKTTLIKVLLALVRPSSGTVRVLGDDIGNGRVRFRDRLGYVPEDDAYMVGQSGIDAVYFAARMAGLPRAEGLRRAHEILDFSGMQQERYRSIETYSTGMRQKVKFARAIVHDPDLLILDEPTSGLDPEERDAMLARITTLARRHGKSVIISTHILPDIERVCDHLVLLHRGKLLAAGSVRELLRSRERTWRVETATPSDEFDRAMRAEFGAAPRRLGPRSWRVQGGPPSFQNWRDLARRTGTALRTARRIDQRLEEFVVESILSADRRKNENPSDDD